MVKGSNICLFFIIFLAISYPLYETDRFLFSVLLILIIFIVLVRWEFKMPIKIKDSLFERITWKVFFPWMQLIVILFLCLAFIGIFKNLGLDNNKKIIIVYCWILPLSTLYAIIRNLISLTIEIRNLTKNDSVVNRILIIAISLFTLALAYVAPNLAFGYGYRVFFDVLLNTNINESIEGYYLSLIISNTLPINGDYLNKIEMISKNSQLIYFQSFHIFFNKLVDGILLASIFSYLTGALKISISKQ